jgi:PAS domain S-box-containing protein
VALTGEPVRFMNEAKALNRWFNVCAYRVGAPENCRVAVHFNDITELKKTEAALLESERRYSALFAHKINGIAHCRVITDQQGRPIDYLVLQVNEAYERIIGIRKAEIEGRRISEVFPDIERYSVDYIGVFGRIALEGGEIKLEEFFEATGQFLSVYVYCPLPGEFTVIFSDVTERKRAEIALRESEQLYHSLFSNMLNGLAYCRMLLLDGKPHDFLYLAVNSAFESLTGLREVVGRKASEVIPGIHESDPQLLEAFGRVAGTGKGERFEIFLEAMQMWFLVSVFSSSPDHFVCVFDVITELKNADLALQDNQRKLMGMAFDLQLAEERERARIAGELHDLVGQRLLLGKMKLDILESQTTSTVSAGEISVIAGLIEESIQDIRSLTFQLRPPVLANEGLVAALGWLCNELKNDYGLEVQFSDDNAVKPLKYEFRSLLFQAVRELLINVVKHAGTKQAWVTLRRADASVVITVEDRGDGFDAAQAGLRSAKNGGYGLFNLRQKIEYLRGGFSWETAPGKGTCSTIVFPLDQTT